MDELGEHMLIHTDEELDLSVRTFNCLKRAGIKNIADLLMCSEEELLNIRNFSKKSLEEVKQKLEMFGLELREP